MRVTLNDGRVLVSHIERALGRTAQNAIDDFEAAPNVAPLMSLRMPRD